MGSFKETKWTIIPFDKDVKNKLPLKEGVYCFVHKKEVLYIGYSAKFSIKN
jgi:hypothetical protein